jgi:hypothetical protein
MDVASERSELNVQCRVRLQESFSGGLNRNPHQLLVVSATGQTYYAAKRKGDHEYSVQLPAHEFS